MLHRGSVAALRLMALAVPVLTGCHRPLPGVDSEREVRFVHLETTGVTSGILIPGTARRPGQPAGFPDVAIAFAKDSNADALQALESLDWRVLALNAPAEREGDGMVLTGVLNPEVRHTPAGPAMADSEPYREFRLSRWCLRAPFMRLRGIQTPADEELPRVWEDDRLRPEDFGHKLTGDLSRFVCAR